MTPEDILETARTIGPYLPDLVGAEAETVQVALATYLAKAQSGEAVDIDILELLAQRDTTREWARQFLQDKVPPPVTRSYDPLAGSVSFVDANTFVCPVNGCDYVWYRPKVGMTSPNCPIHNIALVPAPPLESPT
jgi:hypothetical protein